MTMPAVDMIFCKWQLPVSRSYKLTVLGHNFFERVTKYRANSIQHARIHQQEGHSENANLHQQHINIYVSVDQVIVRENVWSRSKKRKESRFLNFQKRKKRKKLAYI